jgi:hypothetical protein
MAVAFDAKQTTDRTGTATTSFTHTNANGVITVGSGTNRALLVFLQFGAVVSSVSVTWDSGGTNQAMTNIVSATESDNLGQAYLFGLVAPTSGQKTLSVSWTTSASFTCGEASFTGADQTGGATTFKNTNTFVGNNPSPMTITVTTANGDMAVASFAANNCSFTSVSTGTDIYHDNTNVSGAAAYNAAVGASTVVAYGANLANPCCIAACDIAFFTGGTSTPGAIMGSICL